MRSFALWEIRAESLISAGIACSSSTSSFCITPDHRNTRNARYAGTGSWFLHTTILQNTSQMPKLTLDARQSLVRRSLTRSVAVLANGLSSFRVTQDLLRQFPFPTCQCHAAIFRDLRSLDRSSTTPTYQQWLSGQSAESALRSEYPAAELRIPLHACRIQAYTAGTRSQTTTLQTSHLPVTRPDQSR